MRYCRRLMVDKPAVRCASMVGLPEYVILLTPSAEAEATASEHANRADTLANEVQVLQARVHELEARVSDLEHQLQTVRTTTSGEQGVDNSETLEKLKQDLATTRVSMSVPRDQTTDDKLAQ